MAQQPRLTNTEVQRTAVKKLGFLVGKWCGEARIFKGSGESVEMSQTEQAEYKLDGLTLTIEGVGRNKPDGKAALRALGIFSYMTTRQGVSHARLQRRPLAGDGIETGRHLKEITWAFTFGEIKTSSTLRINDKGEWTEFHEITVGSQAPRKFMELRVSRQD